MEKIWIIFEKDYKDDAGTAFTKGLKVEIEKSQGEALISLKFAKTCEKPEVQIDEKIQKSIEGMTETLNTVITKSLEGALSQATEGFKKSKTFAQAIDHKVEGMDGWESTGHFIKGVIEASKPNGKVDDRFIKSIEKFAKGTPSGQNTLNDDEGPAIPDTIAAGIYEVIRQEDDILGMTDQRQTSGQTLLMNTVPETSMKDGYRDAGALAYWMAEADAYTASLLKWSKQRMELHKLGALFYATDEELMDAPVSLGPIFERKGGAAIRFKMNQAFFDGTGVGQPLGIMRSNCMLTVALEANQEIDTITHHNITKMYHRMAVRSRSKAVWLVHPNLEEQLEYIYFNDDTVNKRPIYMPPGGLSSGPYGTLKGKPVIPFDFCYDFGQRGDIVFVDWSQYMTLKSASMQQIRNMESIHVRFLWDEKAFKFTFRIDGKPAWPSAVEDLNGTSKRSCFITLANRSGASSSSGI